MHKVAWLEPKYRRSRTGKQQPTSLDPRPPGRTADPEALAAFRADYGQHNADQTRPYPATADTLRRLAADGWRLGVCTNKPAVDARAIIRAVGLDHLIHGLAGGDTVRKPDPAHLLAAVATVGGAAGRAVMLGDHRNDIHAAQAAGVPSIFAAWGYGAKEMAAGASATAATIADVPALAGRLCPA